MHTRALLLALGVVVACSTTGADKPADWWNTAWRYRTTVRRSTPFRDNTERPVEAAVDVPLLLKKAGIEGQFDPASVRVIARSANGEAREMPYARRTEYDARHRCNQSYLTWFAKPRTGCLPIVDIYFDTVDRGVQPAQYADADLPPQNVIGNPSFEDVTGGLPDGWVLTPHALVRVPVTS